MTAKNAVLKKTGSHYIKDDDGSSRVDGIGKEEVYLYFSATWRGKPVDVTMSADRYAASYGPGGNRLVPWRVYAQDARYHDPERNGGRGMLVTETARMALDKLCESLVFDWLASDAYTTSFQAAAAELIMRKFDSYDTERAVTAALETFRDRLAPEVVPAIRAALDAYIAYDHAAAAMFAAIKGS